MAFYRLQAWLHRAPDQPAPPARQSVPIPEELAAILDRAATEQQRLTWEALRQYAQAAGLPLELLVARAWGRRFPFAELLAAGVPQSALAGYEREWARSSPAEQTRRLQEAFAYAAALRRGRHTVRER
ncbi:MAG TPA: hypothetical protein VF276_03595 [Chloroflexia bacterium]